MRHLRTMNRFLFRKHTFTFSQALRTNLNCNGKILSISLSLFLLQFVCLPFFLLSFSALRYNFQDHSNQAVISSFHFFAGWDEKIKTVQTFEWLMICLVIETEIVMQINVCFFFARRYYAIFNESSSNLLLNDCDVMSLNYRIDWY